MKKYIERATVYMSNTNRSNLYFSVALYTKIGCLRSVYNPTKKYKMTADKSSALHPEAQPEFCNNRDNSKENKRK